MRNVWRFVGNILSKQIHLKRFEKHGRKLIYVCETRNQNYKMFLSFTSFARSFQFWVTKCRQKCCIASEQIKALCFCKQTTKLLLIALSINLGSRYVEFQFPFTRLTSFVLSCIKTRSLRLNLMGKLRGFSQFREWKNLCFHFQCHWNKMG